MSSPTLSVDQIAVGDIPQDPDLWIKAGKNYAVPVNIDSPGVVLSWEFSTEPKVQPTSNIIILLAYNMKKHCKGNCLL